MGRAKAKMKGILQNKAILEPESMAKSQISAGLERIARMRKDLFAKQSHFSI